MRGAVLTAFLVLAPTAAGAATITRGPYLQLGTETSVMLRWRTDSATDSLVRYGADPESLTESVLVPALTTEHTVEVGGLAAATRYYYSVGSSTEVLAGEDFDHYFDTSPPSGPAVPTRVWVLGDSGTADGNAAAVRDAFLAYPGSERTALVLMLGDNAYEDGLDSEFQGAVFDMYPTILRNRVLWPAFGNHDGHSADSDTESGPYYEIFELPRAGEAGGVASGTEAYYSFDYANIHFVCLDSYDSDRSIDGEMLTWLVEDLGDTTQDWIIAYWHHPPYSKGSHDSDTEGALVQMRENAVELLEDFGVDLVLAGHSHAYERSFLIDGHYGDADSFVEAMKADAGDGREEGDGAYAKAALPHQGTVYVVAGTSGKLGGGSLDHPAMAVSLTELGSMILDVSGNRLEAVFLRETGESPDHFAMLKGPDLFPPHLLGAEATSATTVELAFSEPLEGVSAETSGNYAIGPGLSVLSALLLPDGRSVELGTTPLVEGFVYTAEVSGVTDVIGNAVPAGQQAQFTWIDRVTAAFQDGAFPDEGYAGTRDATLEQALPAVNAGAATPLEVDGDDGGGNDLTTLLRWDLSVIPGAAVVESVTLEIVVSNASQDGYEIYPLLTPWVEGETSWNEAQSGVAWALPGATGLGDRGSTVLGVVHAGSTGVRSLPLNAAGVARVQSWVAAPTSNHGLVIADSSESDGLDFASREAASVVSRPRLVVTYHLPLEPDSEAPSVPDGLEVLGVGQDFVTLDWDPSTDNVGVAYYEVVRDAVAVATTPAPPFTDPSVAAGGTYLYRVEAVDTSGNPSGLSASVEATTEPPAACGAADGDTLVLEMDSVSNERSYEVCSELTVRNGYTVAPTGDLTLISGGRIVLDNGFSVQLGGTLTAELDPGL